MIPTFNHITSNETTANRLVASPLEADNSAITCAHLGIPSEPTEICDKLEVEVKRQKRRDLLPPSAEKVLVHSRRIHSISSSKNIFCDDESITENTAVDLQRSAASISVHYFRARRGPDGTFTVIKGEEPCYIGQAFVMNCKSGYKHKELNTDAVFVTAKHNVVAEQTKDDPNVWEFPQPSTTGSVVLYLPQGEQYGMGEIIPETRSDPSQKDDPFFLREVPGHQKAEWRRGYDMSVGPAADVRSWFHDIQRQNLINQLEPLEAVDESFPYEPGTKVALLAFCKDQKFLNELRCVSSDSIVDDLSTEKCDAQESNDQTSEVHETLILTGEITHNGEHHIEYNINTCKGCSGGPIIIIDPNSNEYKRVIAVHAGYNDTVDKNIGFKTNREFRPTTTASIPTPPLTFLGSVVTCGATAFLLSYLWGQLRTRK